MYPRDGLVQPLVFPHCGSQAQFLSSHGKLWLGKAATLVHLTTQCVCGSLSNAYRSTSSFPVSKIVARGSFPLFLNALES